MSASQATINDLDLGFGVQLLKLSNEKGWQPLEIHIVGDDTTIIEHWFPDYQGKIKKNQDHIGIKFETAILANPLVNDSMAAESLKELVNPPLTLSGKIELLFDNMQNNYLPTLRHIAEFFDSTTVEIKNQLKEEGTSYSTLMERWRFLKAIGLLTQTNMKVNEISNRLYYSNTSSFIRAFKRWTGLLPNDFR